ncbi:MAG: tetratricopeptide repeat protein [Sedimentisphaerales bacterium]
MPTMQTVKFALIIAAVAAILYILILSADFVYDDISQVLTDTYIHNPAHFADVLSLKVMSKDIIDNNRPVMLLSLILDSVLWGKTPFGYHLINLLLHSLCSAMVFILLYGLFNRLFPQNKRNIGSLWAAFIGALIFAIHPINSEAVCVVTFREDLLVAFFTLLVLILAERFPTKRIFGNILLGCAIVISVFAAAGAKENGAVAPLYLLIYWFAARKAGQWRTWMKLIAAGFAATAIFMFLRFTIVPVQSTIFVEKAKYLGGSFSHMLAIQPRIWTYQLLELFWPKLLCADLTGYSIRIITLHMALILLSIIIFLSVIISRKNTGFGIGAIFFVLAMLPTSNLIPIFRPVADRYLYLPMVGISIALGAIICQLKIPAKRGFVVVLVSAVCLFLSWFTLQREFVWRNSLSLWQDTVEKNPFSYIGCNNLGSALFDAGEFEKAIPLFTRASHLDPNSSEPIAGLAITYDALGMSAAADKAFLKAVSLDKYYADYDSLMQTLIWTPQQAKKIQIIADRISAKNTTE